MASLPGDAGGRGLARAASWRTRDDKVELVQGTSVAFVDSHDHFLNGFCRLLAVTEAEARRWVEVVVEEAERLFGTAFGELTLGRKLAVLAGAPSLKHDVSPPAEETARGGALPFCGHSPDHVWVPRLGVAPTLSLVGCTQCQHAWLADVESPDGVVAETVYEDEYFEGGRSDAGYGNLGLQQSWRLEKSARLVRRMRAVAALHDLIPPRRVLDVGSGYGFFRKALGDAGIAHDGLEISAHAALESRAAFGFDTHQTSLHAFAATAPPAFDAVTLWDVLEHVRSPVDLLRSAARVIAPGGLVFLRTPNLMALERTVFGSWYHSLKREHLHVFSPRSLLAACRAAELTPVHLESESHLLRGFFGDDLPLLACLLEGSDLFLTAKKPG